MNSTQERAGCHAPSCRPAAAAARVGAEFGAKETGRHGWPRAGGRRATGSLALQRLRRVSVVARTVTRERDSRPPPPWVLCRQLHRPAIFVLLFAFRVILSPDARSALSTICRECHGLVRVAHRAKTRAAKTLLHYL